MESKLWNLVDGNGDTLDEGLTAEEAGEAMAGHDGARWEIRAVGRDESNPDGYWYWALYWGSAHGEPLRQTVFFSLAWAQEDAHAEIMRDVAKRGPEFFGVEAEPADYVHCECGAGDPSAYCCNWRGPSYQTRLVEWMPVHLRESHVAAGGGALSQAPWNGATLLRCEESCARTIVEEEGEWARIVEG